MTNMLFLLRILFFPETAQGTFYDFVLPNSQTVTCHSEPFDYCL